VASSLSEVREMSKVSGYFVFARKDGKLYLVENLNAADAARAVTALRANGWTVTVQG
jgi:hypothetical protein